jgi:hypothetical protein
LNIEDMSYRDLSDYNAVVAWFVDTSPYRQDLKELGSGEIERDYLEAMQEIAEATGASNIRLAQALWRMRKRIEDLERYIEAHEEISAGKES